ncbi:MAG: GGDEF domain-containing protein [Burkholderiales bacterium]|nr:GGDEF domain-containing protein [Burkholderiales bacterium]
MPTAEAPQQKRPAEIAREALLRLAARRIAPTPDAYRDLYYEIAGTANTSGAESVLTSLAASLLQSRGGLADLSRGLSHSIENRDWDSASKILAELSEKCQSAQHAIAPTDISRSGGDQSVQTLREMLAKLLSSCAAPLVDSEPELVAESESLSTAVKEVQSEEALIAIGGRVRNLCLQLEQKGANLAEQQGLQLRLLKLLLENVSELIEDGSWVKGQIGVVQKLISGPIDSHTLEDATRTLKDAIYKQGKLKQSLSEAKVTLKNMMTTVIDQLGTIASSTDDYHGKLGEYVEKINLAEDITELSHILDDVTRETRSVQMQTMRSRDEMVAARREVEQAEARIHSLESQLEQLSELVREDQLTGSLNRRGLEDVYQREAARADRNGTPLCVAMLDLDNFKALNDTHGHSVGDEALVHLVKVVKQALRTTDVIGRYGGEEFLILLPDTAIEEASAVLLRLQRELTKRYFMQNNERLLITFSAGVALRAKGEEQSTVVKRVDEALYRAKRAGKNCVVAAS